MSGPRGDSDTAASARVGVVVVSHSDKIADGLVELAGQMAQHVALRAAGGTDEGGIGTSLEKIQTAIGAADSGAGVVVLCDLGSAIMTAESAIEFLGDDAATVRLADAPLVEGAVAAAVAAETGASVDEVLAAAESAGGSGGAAQAGSDDAAAATPKEAPESGVGSDAAEGGAVTRRVRLINASGLHARPAADFVKLASTFDARVTVDGVDAKSLLGIMSLGARKGTEISIAGDGPDGAEAVAALADLVAGGFGEEE